MTVTIESAVAEDAEMMVPVQIAAFHHDAVLYPGVELDGPPGYASVEHLRERIAQDDCYKICEDGQCIGGMVVFVVDDTHCHLDVIFVHPAHHNRGIGTQAMRFLDDTYPARRWTLDTPTYAVRNQHFYERLGFVRTGEHEADEGIRLIAYERQP